MALYANVLNLFCHKDAKTPRFSIPDLNLGYICCLYAMLPLRLYVLVAYSDFTEPV